MVTITLHVHVIIQLGGYVNVWVSNFILIAGSNYSYAVSSVAHQNSERVSPVVLQLTRVDFEVS